MTLTATNQVNSPFAPGVSSEVFIPDQLIAGNLKLVTENITVASGAPLRGTPMGKITIGTAAATAGTNTGNGTISAIANEKGIKVGSYSLIATSATAFSVFDPNGARLKDATVGVAYSDQIGFTITAGATAFAAGDSFAVAVASGSGSYVASVGTAVDGSGTPVGIIADNADATLGPVNVGMYVMGEFNSNVVSALMDASWTLATLAAALPSNIFLKTAISGAPV